MQKSYNRSKLVQYIVTELNKGTTSTDLARQVAAYLLQANKASDLESVMRDAQEQRALQSGIVEYDIRSAHPLDSAQLSQANAVAKLQYPAAKKMVAHQISDPSVVGGANLAFASSNVDVTIRSKLNRLREAIS